MFQADSKTGNESGGRGFLWDPRLVFVLFSQKSKTRRFVFKSHWWEPKDRAKGIVKDRDKVCEWKVEKEMYFLGYGRWSHPSEEVSAGSLGQGCKFTCFVH